jgi:5-methyltetrahydropteroyltriglutamate--homocysteine methyltransferase
MIAPSCSLLHSPCDLDLEKNEDKLSREIKRWMAFARQKLSEVVLLKQLAQPETKAQFADALAENQAAIASRKTSSLIHNPAVKDRVENISDRDDRRNSPFSIRKQLQKEALDLPRFPTTTIGSFPQTAEVRSWRAKWKKNALSSEEYDALVREEIERAIRWQEEVGLDVLVHGEFERNDMVEYLASSWPGLHIPPTVGYKATGRAV